MREILFRGKTKNDGWKYGGYISPSYNDYETYIQGKEMRDGEFFSLECIYEVIPDTVGQYTGLKDKNGTKIFEGDIIRVCDNNNGYLKVEFKNQYEGGWILTYKEQYLSLGARLPQEIEIIGNVHDNPDLLEVKK